VSGTSGLLDSWSGRWLMRCRELWLPVNTCAAIAAGIADLAAIPDARSHARALRTGQLLGPLVTN
jgi:hypothetical protein